MIVQVRDHGVPPARQPATSIATQGGVGAPVGPVVLGCTLELDSVLELSDALIFIVAFPNVLGLYLLAPKIKETLDDYFD